MTRTGNDIRPNLGKLPTDGELIRRRVPDHSSSQKGRTIKLFGWDADYYINNITYIYT